MAVSEPQLMSLLKGGTCLGDLPADLHASLFPAGAHRRFAKVLKALESMQLVEVVSMQLGGGGREGTPGPGGDAAGREGGEALGEEGGDVAGTAAAERAAAVAAHAQLRKQQVTVYRLATTGESERASERLRHTQRRQCATSPPPSLIRRIAPPPFSRCPRRGK